MAWCEANGVDYVFGLARNERLVGAIADERALAEAESFAMGGSAVRRFADFAWRTLDSWSRARRVVAKAEHLPKGANPRFVVTSLPASAIDARTLYEDVYCARGEVENQIKEQQLDLFADRTSAATMRANQFGCGSRPSPMCCSKLSAASFCATPSSPAPPGARSGLSLKIGAQGEERARKRSPWPRPARTRPSTTSRISMCAAPPSEPPAYRPASCHGPPPRAQISASTSRPRATTPRRHFGRPL